MNTKQPSEWARKDGRGGAELRPVRFVLDPAPAAAGSALIHVGRTQVLCAVALERGVPVWMRQQDVAGGWLTAEYSILPYATEARTRRETAGQKPNGRTQEIQRLIGRVLRMVVDLEALGTNTLWVDCDVLCADGGTRTAAITGAYVALRLAADRWLRRGVLARDPIRTALAAVSVGLVAGQPLLDLDYAEDAAAEVDMNVVMTDAGQFLEVQAAAEGAPFSRANLDRLLKLAGQGIRSLLDLQAQAVAGAQP